MSERQMKISVINIFRAILCVLLLFQNVFAEDKFEDNDSLAAAAPLALERSYNLVANDEDWFKFTNLSPGLLHLKLEHPHNGLADDLFMIVYYMPPGSNEPVVVAADNKHDETEELFYHVIVPGNYFVRVYPVNGGHNTYTLSTGRTYDAPNDDSDEDNDYFEVATEIQDYHEARSSLVANDDDWYTVLAPAGTFKVTIYYDNTEGELDLEVYHSAGNRFIDAIGNSGVIPGGKQVEVSIPAPENIKIVIIGKTGATYSLEIDHPLKWSTVLDSGPASSSSPSIVDIDGDGKNEIIIGTRPYLDNQYNEIKPAQLVCLEDDGSIKWTQVFPASSDPDPITGKVYNTSSIASRPVISDIDGDGQLEVVVGVGVDLDYIEFGDAYSPGHKGGVYALDALTGEIEWSVISKDTIGGSTNTGDGLADGVISSPIVCDVNQDGIQEVIWGGWDEYVYVVDGGDGTHFAQGLGGKWPVNVHDTIWSTPLCADVNNDGLLEILIGADITENSDAYTKTGGIFHIYDRWGRDVIDGFRAMIEFTPGSDEFSFLKGKYEEQTIWSSPIAKDIDGDGELEIAYGTGFFKKDPFGNYLRIWNHDGTLYLKLATLGRPFSVPLFADLDNDGIDEIIATTSQGWLHVWSNTGEVIFATQTFASGAQGVSNPVFSSMLAVDLDSDDKLEIIYQLGASIVIVDHTGVVLTDSTKWGMYNEYYRGTPAIGDLDGDGNLEIVTGGANSSNSRGVVYAFNYGSEGNADNYRYARRQFRETGVREISSVQAARRVEVENFVTRFYVQVLGRSPDSWGLSDWVNRLIEGDKSGSDVARGFVLGNEFINQNTSNDEFVNILYITFFNREADAAGLNEWLTQLGSGGSRVDVLNGFLGSQEFINLSNSFGIAASFKPTEGLSRVLIEEFVTRFYQQVVLRQPDPEGLAAWVDALMLKSLSAEDVGEGFIFSQEFIDHGTDNTEFIKVLYRAFFGRSADLGGLSLWVSSLESGALTRRQIMYGVLGSLEFIELANSFGIVVS